MKQHHIEKQEEAISIKQYQWILSFLLKIMSFLLKIIIVIYVYLYIVFCGGKDVPPLPPDLTKSNVCDKYTYLTPTSSSVWCADQRALRLPASRRLRPDQSNILLVLGENIWKDFAHTGILPTYEACVRVRYLHGYDTEHPGTNSSKICFWLLCTNMHNNCSNYHIYCFGSHNFGCFMESPHQN